MRAIRKVASEPAAVELVEVDRPEPAAGEAIVRVAATGVCGTDAHVYDWEPPQWVEPPVTLGHEFAGEVVETAPATSEVAVGDGVVAMPIHGCGECRTCREGAERLCEGRVVTGIHRDGGMAEFVAVPTEQLVVLPDGYPLDVAALTEPTAVALHALDDRARLSGGEHVVVQGAGPIGVLTALVARTYDPRSVILVGTDVDEAVRFPLAQDLGFETVNVDQDDLVAEAREHTDGEDVDVVVDASGHPAGLEQALRIVRGGGSVVAVGTPGDPSSVDVSTIVRNEVDVSGSFAARPRNFRWALEVLQTDVDCAALTRTYSPSNPATAFEHFLAKRVCKPVFGFDGLLDP